MKSKKSPKPAGAGEGHHSTPVAGDPAPTLRAGSPVEFGILSALGTKFSLRNGEEDTFNQLYRIYHKSKHEVEDKRGGKKPWADDDELGAEVHASIKRLKQAVNGAASDEQGHRFVQRLPLHGRRYVVFSDYHMGPAGARQDFFGSSGNLAMMTEVLGEYERAQFTVIDNGDVEELLLFEPTLAEASLRASLAALGWDQLDQHRREARRRTLDQIFTTHRDFYVAVARLYANGHYVRTAGNHDYDLQLDDFNAALMEQLTTLAPLARAASGARRGPFMVDYVILEDHIDDASTSASRFVITHGHQFDRSCTPKFAPRIGEVITECIAWIYQGPDRHWLWHKDNVVDWVERKKGFLNNLVGDVPETVELNFWQKLGAVAESLGKAFLVGNPIGIQVALLEFGSSYIGHGKPINDYSIRMAIEALPSAVTNDRGFWEWAFGHNVGWEYFLQDNPREAFFREVMAGDRMFKYRHMNELKIRKWMREEFDNSPPSLVLGHSHEVRFRPAFTAALGREGGRYDGYFNTGAAGRFENLIWGLEIDDGTPQLISWSRPDGPKSGAAPERRVWQDISTQAANIGASALFAGPPTPLL